MLVFSKSNDAGYGDNGDGDKDENISFHHDDEEDNDNEYEEDDGDDKEDVDDGNDGGLPMIKVNSCPFLASDAGAGCLCHPADFYSSLAMAILVTTMVTL